MTASKHELGRAALEPALVVDRDILECANEDLQECEWLAEQKASDKVFEDAAADAAGIADGAKFDTVAQERGTKIDETPLLSKGAVVPGISDAPALFEAASTLEKPGDAASQPVKVGRDYYVIALGLREESYIPQLAEVRDSVEKDYRQEQGLDAGRKRADEWLAAAKSGTSLEQIAQQNQLEVKKSEPFTADAKATGNLGAVPGLGEVAFKTAKDGEPLARSFASGATSTSSIAFGPGWARRTTLHGATPTRS